MTYYNKNTRKRLEGMETYEVTSQTNRTVIKHFLDRFIWYVGEIIFFFHILGTEFPNFIVLTIHDEVGFPFFVSHLDEFFCRSFASEFFKHRF